MQLNYDISLEFAKDMKAVKVMTSRFCEQPRRFSAFRPFGSPIAGLVLAFILNACASSAPESDIPEASAPPLTPPRISTAPPPDGRLTVNSREYPWSAVGRLNIAGRGFCTGFLISPRHVVTRADCLFDANRGEWRPLLDLHFVAGYQSDRYQAASALKTYRTAEGYNPRASQSLASLTRNWALLTLEQPIGQKTGWLGITWQTRNDNAPPALKAGYRRDWQHAVSLYYGCAEGGCPLLAGEKQLPVLVLEGGRFSVPGHLYLPSNERLLAELRRVGLGPSRGRPPENGRTLPRPEKTSAILLWQLGYLIDAPKDASAASIGNAIKGFQEVEGLPSDGVASVALLGRLLLRAYEAAIATPIS